MAQKIVIGGNYRPGQIPAAGSGRRWKAFSIHPESLIDRCYVGGELLVVGSLAYVDSSDGPAVAPARGYPTGPHDDLVPGFGDAEPNSPLILTGFTDCDEIQAPARSRAPWSDGVVLNVGTGTGGTGTLQTVYGDGPVLTIPFMGRRAATIFIHADANATAGTSQVTLVVRGRRYFSPANCARLKDTEGPHIDENTALVYTYAQGGALADGENIAATYHIGGFDSEECFDELEVWAKKSSVDVWNGLCFIDGEAHGERLGP